MDGFHVRQRLHLFNYFGSFYVILFILLNGLYGVREMLVIDKWGGSNHEKNVQMP
jgi:hypothetical protein